MVENIATLVLLQFGQCIALPSSSIEYLLILSKICCACIASVDKTLSLTPPIALLTKGSVSIVILSLKKTAIPSDSNRPFIIWASAVY